MNDHVVDHRMDPAQSQTNPDNQNSQKVFCKQPITCPWITTQPYPSTMNKNRANDSTQAKPLPNIPLSVETRTINEKTCPSLQHSSSQFFYFLRLMQLFPETHPATLHTVLCLCKNDFFCAVDKLLYAKRCKALYSRSQGMFKRCSVGRSHPYCAHGGGGKVIGQQERVRSCEMTTNSNRKEVVDLHKSPNVEKVHIVVENSSNIVEEGSVIPSISTENETILQTADALTSTQTSTITININNENENNEAADDVTSRGNWIEAQESQCDKTAEA